MHAFLAWRSTHCSLPLPLACISVSPFSPLTLALPCRWPCNCVGPLQAGLTTAQSLLYFEAAAHHYLAITTVFMAIVPIVYLFSGISPMVSVLLIWQPSSGQ